MRDIKNAIVKALHEYMAIPIVPTDTADRKPGYPYISYKITTSHEAETFSLVDNLVDNIVPSLSERFNYDVEVIRKEQAHFTLSISVYSDNDDTAMALAYKARDWFKFSGYFYMVDMNIVVVNTTNITDRTQRLIDEFEWRYGFDVRIRAARDITKRVETIEEYNFNKL